MLNNNRNLSGEKLLIISTCERGINYSEKKDSPVESILAIAFKSSAFVNF